MNETPASETKKPTIDSILDEASKKLAEVDKIHNQAISLMSNIDESNCSQKLDQIKAIHAGIFSGDSENNSIEEEMNQWMAYLRSSGKKVEGMKNEIFGHPGSTDEEKTEGYIDEMKGKLEEIENRYTSFYQKIEEELDAGVVTVSLSKAFHVKAEQFRVARKVWEKAISSSLIVGILLSLSYYYFHARGLSDWDLAFSFLKTMPIYTFFIWGLVFMGNRRAENQKLEEIYKHKAAMAQSFTGYKKTITDLSEDDSAALKTLMDNLLEVIKKDPSDFLSVKGEKHPIMDITERSEG